MTYLNYPIKIELYNEDNVMIEEIEIANALTTPKDIDASQEDFDQTSLFFKTENDERFSRQIDNNLITKYHLIDFLLTITTDYNWVDTTTYFKTDSYYKLNIYFNNVKMISVLKEQIYHTDNEVVFKPACLVFIYRIQGARE